MKKSAHSELLAPYGEGIFDEFCLTVTKESADFPRSKRAEGAGINRRRACALDSLMAKYPSASLLCRVARPMGEPLSS